MPGKQCIVLFTVVLALLSISGICFAGFQEGREAYDKGDYGKAISILTSLAESGDVSSRSLLGYIYESGIGAPKDYAMAAKWYRLAAEKGNTEAKFKMGYLYEHGGYGFHRDYREAYEWYLKASNDGYGQAKFNIGNMYEIGMGVTQDYEEAMKWYKDALDHGIASGGDSLSRLNWGVSSK